MPRSRHACAGRGNRGEEKAGEEGVSMETSAYPPLNGLEGLDAVPMAHGCFSHEMVL